MKHILLVSTAIIALSAPAFATDIWPWYSAAHSDYPTGKYERQRSDNEYWAHKYSENREREERIHAAREQEEQREHADDREHNKKKHSDNGNHYGQKKHPKEVKHGNGNQDHYGRR